MTNFNNETNMKDLLYNHPNFGMYLEDLKVKLSYEYDFTFEIELFEDMSYIYLFTTFAPKKECMHCLTKHEVDALYTNYLLKDEKDPVKFFVSLFYTDISTILCDHNKNNEKELLSKYEKFADHAISSIDEENKLISEVLANAAMALKVLPKLRGTDFDIINRLISSVHNIAKYELDTSEHTIEMVENLRKNNTSYNEPKTMY